MATRIDLGRCPHCGRTDWAWRKRIISTAAASLCKLVGMYAGQPIHIDDFTVLAKDRNFSQLVLWNLIESAPCGDAKRASGKWSPTERGKKFARGEISVMQYVVTKQNEILRFEPPMITIRKALSNRFCYRTLIGANRQGRRVNVRQMGLEMGAV